MTTYSFPAPTREIADALGVCQTATSRKIAAAEQLLQNILCGNPKSEILNPKFRKDRNRTAIAARLRTIGLLAANRPRDEFDLWLKKCEGSRECEGVKSAKVGRCESGKVKK